MRKSLNWFKIFLVCQVLILGQISSFAQINGKAMIWIMSDLLDNRESIPVLGDPKVIDSPYGKAVLFNGADDGILTQDMPLMNLSEFTIEMLIRFDSGGCNEQRYFHAGTVQQDRLLLEIRSVGDSWYLDGFVQSNDNWVALISPDLTHPLDRWYHIAFTVKDGRQITFVNGKKELEGAVSFSPLVDGSTSIGVRQNKISWFKGAVYSIRITDKVLNPNEFMAFR